jgi:hypothetical protein
MRIREKEDRTGICTYFINQNMKHGNEKSRQATVIDTPKKGIELGCH